MQYIKIESLNRFKTTLGLRFATLIWLLKSTTKVESCLAMLPAVLIFVIKLKLKFEVYGDDNLPMVL